MDTSSKQVPMDPDEATLYKKQPTKNCKAKHGEGIKARYISIGVYVYIYIKYLSIYPHISQTQTTVW